MSEPLSNSGTVGEVAARTVDDINDIFKELDSEKDDASGKETEKSRKEKETKDTEDQDKEAKELGEGDIELIEPEDEEEEEKIDLSKPDDDIEIDAPPRKAAILKKYPEIFKEFPFIEKMLYRDKQYSQLFGSFDDAKEIAEKSEVFNEFESQLLAGNTTEIIKNVKETDPKAFDKLVDNYMSNLAKADKDAYFEVIGNMNKHLIMELIKEGNESNNDELKQAALILNQFLFGTAKFSAPRTRTTETKPDEKSEAEQERLSFIQERFETTRDDLQVRVDNVLKSTISQYIDPKNVMSGYVKKNAVTDALKILNDTLGRDEALKSNLNRLWRQAFDSKFSKDSVGKIQSHYLGRAKGYLKTAIMKARAEALKDITPSTRRNEDEEEKETPQKRGQIPSGRPSSGSKNEMRKGESVQDFFMRE